MKHPFRITIYLIILLLNLTIFVKYYCFTNNTINEVKKTDNEPLTEQPKLLEEQKLTKQQEIAKIDEIAQEEDGHEEKLIIKVEQGDTFINLLTDLAIDKKQIYQIMHSLHKVYNVKKLRPNDYVLITIQNTPEYVIQSLIIEPHNANKIEITYKNNHFIARVLQRELVHKTVKISGTIHNNLFSSLVHKGLSATTAMQMIRIYRNNLDLKHDIQPGSQFTTLVNQVFDDKGRLVSSGEVIYTEIITKHTSLKLYRYQFSDGRVGYFNNNGISAQRFYLQMPISNTYISSRFGMRHHPILRRVILHKGVDLAGRYGSPIQAAANGVVEYVGIRSGYGKYIRIRHRNGYATAYGHLSKFGSKTRRGLLVKQGQIIGYVGSTGRATGPHLHYEVIYRGRHIDPLKVHTATNRKLRGKQMRRFQSIVEAANNKVSKEANI